jgi:hypothetical protein
MEYSRPRTNRRPIEEVETVVAGMQIGRVLTREAFEGRDLGKFLFWKTENILYFTAKKW